MRTRRGRHVLAVGVVALFAGALVLAPAADAKRKKPGSKITVMTRNLFLGTDLLKIAGATTVADFRVKATAGYNEVKANEFQNRAKLLAKEIKRTKPDVIGLQEVALWRTGPIDGVRNNASKVEIDYLALLRKALKNQHLKYKVGAVQNEADVEGPTSGGFDVRLTMRDATLIRKRDGLKVTKSKHHNFNTIIQFPSVLGLFPVERGWVYNDLKLGKRKFRFVDTHLESYLAPQRLAQAKELVAPGGPANTSRQTILVGDLNSDPKGGPGTPGPEPDAYNAVIGLGFVDTWLTIHPGDPGFECCLKQNNLLDPPPGPFDHRIDHILTRPGLTPTRAVIVGTDPALNRLPNGRWESDHGGVVTTLRLK